MLVKMEELSLNAWPALETYFLDGWILRFAAGYTRRANSVNLLYPSHHDLSEKIAQCEAVYSGKGLPVIFKLAGRKRSQAIDQLLGLHGYGSEGVTSVQWLDLSTYRPAEDLDIQLDPVINSTWEQWNAQLHSLTESQI